MINQYLKTKNEILNTLNEKYYVMQRGVIQNKKVPGVYDIYTDNLDYIFSVEIKGHSLKNVIFNGIKYTSVNKLLKDVEIFNSNLFFPPNSNDPILAGWAREERKISWYLREKLCLTFDYDIGYSVKDSLGKELFSFNYTMDYNNRLKNNGEIDMDSTKGCITQSLGGCSLLTIDFDGAEDAIKKINSIIVVEFSPNVDKMIEILSNLINTLDDLKDAEVLKYETLIQGQKIKFKEVVLPIMKELIKKFEE